MKKFDKAQSLPGWILRVIFQEKILSSLPTRNSTKLLKENVRGVQKNARMFSGIYANYKNNLPLHVSIQTNS